MAAADVIPLAPRRRMAVPQVEPENSAAAEAAEAEAEAAAAEAAAEAAAAEAEAAKAAAEAGTEVETITMRAPDTGASLTIGEVAYQAHPETGLVEVLPEHVGDAQDHGYRLA